MKVQSQGMKSAWTPVGLAVSRGFTLIELMVVLVIIGLLAALIVPNVLDRADDARVTTARTDVNNLMQALKLYRLDNQSYPTAEQGLQALVAASLGSGALPSIAPSMIATSVTVRAIGPAVSWLKNGGEFLLEGKFLQEFDARNRAEGQAFWLMFSKPL